MKAPISPIYAINENTGKQFKQGDGHHIAVTTTSFQSKKQSGGEMS